MEFRHKSWWNDNTFAQFQAAGVIFCSCSGPRLPDELGEDGPTRFIFAFMGPLNGIDTTTRKRSFLCGLIGLNRVVQKLSGPT